MVTNINQITNGKYIPPIKRISLFTPSEWEDFIREWVEVKKSGYYSIEKLGGTGDKGRDVIGYLEDPQKNPTNYSWDCYQCKHYKAALAPTNIYVEFGKILYYTFKKDYPVPNNYFFVAPHGVGTKLNDLLNNPLNLKNEVITNWDQYCKTNIVTGTEVILDGNFLEYVKKFDFKIFKKTKVTQIIEDHKSHHNHLLTFGGGLKERDPFNENDIPIDIQKGEINYVKKLIRAYEDHGKVKIDDASKLTGNYYNHFIDARLGFYYAQQLDRLYRDSLPPGTFDNFKNEIFDGVKGLNYASYPNGFNKVISIEQEAKKIAITSNPLINVSNVNDRIGICHHLSNDNKLTWLNNE